MAPPAVTATIPSGPNPIAALVHETGATMAAEHRAAALIHQEQDGGARGGPDRRDRAQQLCLDAGRVLLLLGGLVVATVPPAKNTKNPGGGARAANTMCAFVGFLLWILCVCFLAAALSPAGRRFPRAARAGAAVASAVLKCFLPPVN
ncbi:hypothetical protein ACP70R_044025 [Stipagrostis hirtigluma subsp. patula]